MEAVNIKTTLLSSIPNVLPKDSPPLLVTSFENAVRNTFERHGASAFAAPREAAIAHEVGHAIVGTHERIKIRQITICAKTMPGLGEVWGGTCLEAGGWWNTGPDSTADQDLRRARFIVAGLAGEMVTGWDKPGSSLDEQAMSQLVGINAAAKLCPLSVNQADYRKYVENFWNEQIWVVACKILCGNQEPFHQLAGHLHQHGRVQGATLRKALARVQRIAP
jgi:hypothetical protein